MLRHWMFRAAAAAAVIGAGLAPACIAGQDDPSVGSTSQAYVAPCTIGQNLGEEWSGNTQNVTYACSTTCNSVKIVKTIYWYEGDTLKSRVEDPGCPSAI